MLLTLMWWCARKRKDVGRWASALEELKECEHVVCIRIYGRYFPWSFLVAGKEDSDLFRQSNDWYFLLGTSVAFGWLRPILMEGSNINL